MPKALKIFLRVIFITLGIIVIGMGSITAYIAWDSKRAVKEAAIDISSQVTGNPDGKMTIVEFVDYRCHYCPILNATLGEALQFEKDVKVVIRPVGWVDEQSKPIASFLIASGKQGKYVELHKKLMDLPSLPDYETVKTIAGSLGIDVAKAEEDAKGKDVEAQIEENQGYVMRSGFPGIPALIIGDRQFFLNEENMKSVNALRMEISDAYDRKAEQQKQTD